MANDRELNVRDKKTQIVWTAKEKIARHRTSELSLAVHGMGRDVWSPREGFLQRVH